MDNWYILVALYTYRKSSIPTDRILAISGIAERYGRPFGDQYCAGLWRSTLPEALYWKTSNSFPSGAKRRPDPKYGKGRRGHGSQLMDRWSLHL
jgi:hypothetical protein